jgi:Fe-S cluster assembly protein SufD
MAQVLAKENRYLSDFQTFTGSVAANDPAWLRGIRQQALARFAELGFPTARRGNEKWKYTSVVPIANATFEYPFDDSPQEVKPADLRRLAPWDDSWVNLVFVNGRYSEALSTPPTRTEGARVMNLAGAIAEDRGLVEKHLAKYAAFEDDAFTALNTAFLKDGAFVHIPEDAPHRSPLHLLYVTTGRGQPIISHPRTLVVAGRHSRSAIIESHVSLSSAHHFTNSVTEISVEDGAEIEHHRLLSEAPGSFHVGATRVHQGRDSTFSSASFSRGAALARNDLFVLLDAPGSSCYLNGLYMTSGTQHIDNYINVDHAGPHTKSRLRYKGILDGKSKAVFGGTVLVRRDAQKADSQQSDKNLVLSEDAEVNSKPSLLIYADDVKCSHGATAGNIDESTLFYMRSRGLDLETASSLLIHGFASEIIETVRLDPFRAYLDKLFLAQLPNSHSSHSVGGTP